MANLYVLQGRGSSGSNLRVWRSTNDGTTWAQYGPTLVNKIGANVNPEGNGLAHGNDASIWVSNIGNVGSEVVYELVNGTTWHNRGSASANREQGIWSFATDNTYVVSNGLVRHWNGSTWSTAFSWTASSSLDYASIWASATDDIWVAGVEKIAGFHHKRVWHWNGSTWSVSLNVFPTGNPFFMHIHGWGPNDIVVAGSTFGNTGVYKWNGSSWSNISTAIYGAATNMRIAGKSGTDFWILLSGVGSGSSAVGIRYTGSWSGPTSVTDIRGIWGGWGDSNYGWAGGCQFPGTLTTCNVWRWNGSAWSDVSPGSAPADGCVFAIFQDSDSTAPVLQNLDPANGETQVLQNTTLTIEIVDQGVILSGVDTDTVEITIAGDLAWSSDTEQTGFSVVKTAITDGFRYVIDPDNDFSSYQLVEVRVVANDVAGNSLDETYTFRIKDTEEPIFSDVSPTPNSENVSQNTLITLNIYDKGSGVDKSGIVVVVDGQTVYDGNTDTFFSPFDVSSSITPTTVDGYDGYALSLDRNGAYKANEKITVEITAPDLEGN